MTLILVQCPAWGIQTPPLGLACLLGVVRTQGHEAIGLDLNIQMYRRVDEAAQEYWQVDRRDQWLVADFFHGSKLEKLLQPFIHEWADQILAQRPTMVGFSLYHTTRICSLWLARQLKQRQPALRILCGGPECQRFHAAQSLIEADEVDAVVIGEGEETLLELLEFTDGAWPQKLKGALLKINGSVVDGGDREPLSRLDEAAMPDFTDFTLADYQQKILPLLGSRGCVGHCVICNERRYWQGFRFRSAESLVAEMAAQACKFSINAFHFNDSLMNGNLRELVRMCELLIAQGCRYQWSGAARALPAMTAEVLSAMKRAGCTGFSLGVESGSQQIVDAMRKGFKVVDAIRIIKTAHELGMRVSFNLIVGFPEETWRDIFRTLLFLIRIRGFGAELEVLSTCLISEGSELAACPEKFGVRYTDDLFWRSEDGRNTFPKRLRRLVLVHDLARAIGILTRFRKPPAWQRQLETGYYYRTLRENKKAVKHLRRALKGQPEDAKLLAEIADCYRVMNRLGPARRYLERGRAIDPANVDIVRVEQELHIMSARKMG